MAQRIQESISFQLMEEAAPPLLHCRGKSQAGFEVRDNWIPGVWPPQLVLPSPGRAAAASGGMRAALLPASGSAFQPAGSRSPAVAPG